jgi:hypothetical protein
MGYLKVLGTVLSLIISTFAVLRLWDAYSGSGATGLLQLLLDDYEAITGRVFAVLQPVPEWIKSVYAGLTGWTLELYPHWKDIFSLLGLYVAAHASHALSLARRERRVRAFSIRMIVGMTLALLAGTAAGVIPAVGTGQVLLTIGCSVIGLVAYRVAAAAQYAFDRWQFDGLRFLPIFANKAVGAVVFGVAGGTLLLAAWLLSSDGKTWFVNPGFLVLMLILTLLGLYHLISGIADGLKESPATEPAISRWERLGGLIRKGNVTIGLRILGTIVLAILAIEGLN